MKVCTFRGNPTWWLLLLQKLGGRLISEHEEGVWEGSNLPLELYCPLGDSQLKHVYRTFQHPVKFCWAALF